MWTRGNAEEKSAGIQNNRQGGKDGERLKREIERVERNDEGFQEEAAGSRTGHDEPHALQPIGRFCFKHATGACSIQGWLSSPTRPETQPLAASFSIFSRCREAHFWSAVCILLLKVCPADELKQRNPCSARVWHIFYSLKKLHQQEREMDACMLLCLSASMVCRYRLPCQS